MERLSFWHSDEFLYGRLTIRLISKSDCLFITFIDKRMTIRHKVNISQKLAEFEQLISKYPAVANAPPPTQPQYATFAKNKQQGVPLFCVPSQKAAFKKTYGKEQTIKQIDDKINSIMKKHDPSAQKDSNRSPLQPRNINLQELDKDTVDLFKRTKQCRSEGKPNIDKSNEVPLQPRTGVLKQESRRIRERSMQIFDSNQERSTGRKGSVGHDDSKGTNKYDSEIERLNERIRIAEENKKKLNIDFSPFTHNRKASKTNIEPVKEIQTQKIKVELSIPRPSPIKENIIEVPKEKKIDVKVQLSTPSASSLPLKSTSSLPTATTISNQTIFLDEAPTARKTQQAKTTIKQLADSLCQQIKLDEQFRNNKIWFTFSNESNKWQKIQAEFQKKNIKLSIQQCRTLFESTVEEHNPFFKWDGTTFNAGVLALIESFEKCEANWKQNVLKKCKRQHLQNEGFKNELLNNSRKENIVIQDIVRFLNMQTGTFHRNRDLHLIFKRMVCKCSLILSYSNFISAVTYE